jgi:hypothetical protein
MSTASWLSSLHTFFYQASVVQAVWWKISQFRLICTFPVISVQEIDVFLFPVISVQAIGVFLFLIFFVLGVLGEAVTSRISALHVPALDYFVPVSILW